MQTSFSQWIDALRKHWLLSALMFAAVITLTVLVILYYPRAYRSQAKLLLRVGRESVKLDPTASTDGDKLNIMQTREHEMQTALGVMQSDTLIERIVDQVGEEVVLSGHLPGGDADVSDESILSSLVGPAKAQLASIDPIPDRERAIRSLRKEISISAPSESSVVSIEYRAKSPEAAQKVVEAWLDQYISLHVKVNRTQGTHAFFEQQDATLKQQLDATREELRKLKSDANLVTIEGQQKLLESQLAALRTALLETEGELAGTESRVQEIQKLLTNEVSPNIEEVTAKANEAIDEMRAQLFEMETLEQDLRSKLKPGHPKLSAVTRQLEDLRAIFAEQSTERDEVTRTANPAYQKLLEEQLLQKASARALENKKSTLLKKQLELQVEVAALNENEKAIQALANEVTILENRYAAHADKLEQARLDDVLEQQRITSVNVVQPASLERRPVTPDKKFCAIFGVFAAVLAAVGFPLLKYSWQLHHTLLAATIQTPVGSDQTATETSDTTNGAPATSSSPAPVAVGDAATKPR